MKEDLQSMLELFSEGSGFGDPEARQNAELRLQVLLAREQSRIASRLNMLTFLLVVVGPNAPSFLKPGVTFQQLDTQAHAISDNEAARQLNLTRTAFFQSIAHRSRTAA